MWGRREKSRCSQTIDSSVVENMWKGHTKRSEGVLQELRIHLFNILCHPNKCRDSSKILNKLRLTLFRWAPKALSNSGHHFGVWKSVFKLHCIHFVLEEDGTLKYNGDLHFPQTSSTQWRRYPPSPTVRMSDRHCPPYHSRGYCIWHFNVCIMQRNH